MFLSFFVKQGEMLQCFVCALRGWKVLIESLGEIQSIGFIGQIDPQLLWCNLIELINLFQCFDQLQSTWSRQFHWSFFLSKLIVKIRQKCCPFWFGGWLGGLKCSDRVVTGRSVHRCLSKSISNFFDAIKLNRSNYFSVSINLIRTQSLITICYCQVVCVTQGKCSRFVLFFEGLKGSDRVFRGNLVNRVLFVQFDRVHQTFFSVSVGFNQLDQDDFIDHKTSSQDVFVKQGDCFCFFLFLGGLQGSDRVFRENSVNRIHRTNRPITSLMQFNRIDLVFGGWAKGLWSSLQGIIVSVEKVGTSINWIDCIFECLYRLLSIWEGQSIKMFSGPLFLLGNAVRFLLVRGGGSDGAFRGNFGY